MFKKSMFEDELIAGMQRELTANDQSIAVNNLDTAIENLHSAVEVFEEAGMTAQADAILNILLRFAKKDPHTAGLTSEKMIQNLLHHGTEFNMADDGSINDLLEADMEGDDLDVFDADFKDMDFEDEL